MYAFEELPSFIKSDKRCSDSGTQRKEYYSIGCLIGQIVILLSDLFFIFRGDLYD